MIKAIVFDAYGTLISTGNGSINATKRILNHVNRNDISEREFYAKWKEFHREHINTLKTFLCEKDIFLEDLKRLYHIYQIESNPNEDINFMLDTLGNRTVFPEVNQTLRKLRTEFTLCIGSTTDTEPLINDIKRNNIFVDKVFTSENLRVYKPKSEFYHAILNDLQIKPEEILFVGDSLIDDIWGPKQIGIMTCHICRKHAETSDIIPDYVISTLDELINILKK